MNRSGKIGVKLNSICKNSDCQKAFAACLYCVKKQSWRSLCCSARCYQKYAGQVLSAREKADLYPERTDMTKEQIMRITNMSYDEIKAKTILDEEVKI